MTNYYIDPDVTAGGAGTEIDPFKLWSEVSWAAGNSYFQKRGTTSSAQITITGTGTAGNPIVLSDYGAGEKPIIDLADASAHGMLANGRAYIEISNFVIKNVGKSGIVFFGNDTVTGDGCKVSDCEFYDIALHGVIMSRSAGISNIRSDCLIENCYAIRCGESGFSIVDGQENCTIRNCTAIETCLTGNSWGIYMRPRGQAQTSGTWTNVGGNVWQHDLNNSGTLEGETITRVIASSRTTSGPHDLAEGTFGSVGPNEWAQSGDLWQIDIQENPNPVSVNVITLRATGGVIENCIATDTDDFGGVNDGTGIGMDIGVEQGIIRNCISTGSKGAGFECNLASGCIIHSCIAVDNNDAGIRMPTALVMSDFAGWDNQIYNNTCIGSITQGGIRVIRSEQQDIYNNIFLNNPEDIEDSGTNVFTEDYNCSYGNIVTNISGGNDITTDPDLDVNYKPSTSASPAVGAGYKWWGDDPRPSGYDGEPFPDTQIDIGANQTTFDPNHPSNL